MTQSTHNSRRPHANSRPRRKAAAAKGLSALAAVLLAAGVAAPAATASAATASAASDPADTASAPTASDPADTASTATASAPAATASAPTASSPHRGDPRAESGVRHLRGELVSVTGLDRLDRGQVRDWLRGQGMELGDGGGERVRYGVRAYRVVYRTVDAAGRPTTASGLLTLPTGGAHRLDLVSDTHGTMVHRDYAPSVATDFARVPSYLQAAAGRAVAAPDYLGLGTGPGRHPYMDTASAVTASVDRLRAARHAAAGLGRPLTGDVYATGFSQGGQVAMALGKALDAGADRHFRLRGLAPVSGPYDLSGEEIPALYDGRVNDTSGVFYTAYFLTAQNRLHPLYKDPAEVFRAPYAARVEALFDGRHEEEDIVTALPATVRDLLTPAFYERLRHPTGALKETLEANDTACAWKPAAPVRLYAASGDTDVPIGNARSCARQLAARGATAPVLDQGAALDHFGGYKAAAPQLVRWFDQLSRTAG